MSFTTAGRRHRRLRDPHPGQPSPPAPPVHGSTSSIQPRRRPLLVVFALVLLLPLLVQLSRLVALSSSSSSSLSWTYSMFWSNFYPLFHHFQLDVWSATAAVEAAASPSSSSSSAAFVPSLSAAIRTRATDSLGAAVCLTWDCLADQGRQLAHVYRQSSSDPANRNNAHHQHHPHRAWCTSTIQIASTVVDAITSNTTSDSKKNSTRFIRWQGLLLVKVPKAASSTLAGVVLRISNRTRTATSADAHSSSKSNVPAPQAIPCAVEWEHREGRSYRHRDRQRSFLFTSIRHPAARALSAVGYFIWSPQANSNNINHYQNNATNAATTDGTLPISIMSDTALIKSLHTKRGGRTKGKGGYQYNYMSLTEIAPHDIWHPLHPTQLQQPLTVLHNRIRTLLWGEYDFIVVAERMDESLVVLAWLLNVSVADVLHVMDSKRATNDYVLVRYGRHAGTCQRQYQLGSRTLSLAVQEHLQTTEWMLINYMDYLLHAAANASLDRTIDEGMGREQFTESLTTYRRLKQHVMEYCEERVGPGCTASGHVVHPISECYERDFGCGFRCVDEALETLSKTTRDSFSVQAAPVR